MTSTNSSNRSTVNPYLPKQTGSSDNLETTEQVIDSIASYYILTMDFVSLNKLLEKQYCDDLIVLTADIINNHVTQAEIEYLEQKIVNGVPKEEIVKKNVSFFKQSELNKMDIPDPVNKQRACIGIAKYYIKIAHLFASIVMTLNPVYSYLDKTGNTVNVPLYKKDTIPKGAEVKLEEYGICGERIRALRSDNKYDGLRVGDAIQVSPNVCAMNKKLDGSIKSLVDEPGIPELMHLYYDDKYDFKKGVFTGMSPETQKEYENNVREFYAQFTGNKEVPEDIKEFRDIKLKDYSKTPQCATNARNSGKLTSELKTDTTERYTLFSKYAQHVQSMMLNANKNQEKLVQIINQLFEKQPDPNGAESVRIHKDLTESKLQQLVVDARKLIIELYLKCEMDYQEGLNIYEAIVQSSIVKTTEKQVRELTALKDKYANALNVSPGVGSQIIKDTEKEKGNSEDKNKEKEKGTPKDKEKYKEKEKEKGENKEKDIQVPYISIDNPIPPKESSQLEIAKKDQINEKNMDSKEEMGKPADIPMNKESLVGDVIDKRDSKYAEEKYLLAGEQEEKENK